MSKRARFLTTSGVRFTISRGTLTVAGGRASVSAAYPVVDVRYTPKAKELSFRVYAPPVDPTYWELPDPKKANEVEWRAFTCSIAKGPSDMRESMLAAYVLEGMPALYGEIAALDKQLHKLITVEASERELNKVKTRIHALKERALDLEYRFGKTSSSKRKTADATV